VRSVLYHGSPVGPHGPTVRADDRLLLLLDAILHVPLHGALGVEVAPRANAAYEGQETVCVTDMFRNVLSSS
jgi:hypothetical protein